MTTEKINKATGEIDEGTQAEAPEGTIVLPPPLERIKFADWLAEFNGGALDDDLSAAIHELAQQVILHGKVGTLTLKLSMKDEGGGVIVQSDVTAKPPKVPRSAFFYSDGARQGLTRRDPLQPEMPGMPPHTD